MLRERHLLDQSTRQRKTTCILKTKIQSPPSRTDRTIVAQVGPYNIIVALWKYSSYDSIQQYSSIIVSYDSCMIVSSTVVVVSVRSTGPLTYYDTSSFVIIIWTYGTANGYYLYRTRTIVIRYN